MALRKVISRSVQDDSLELQDVYGTSNLPATNPKLLLDFVNSKTLDSKIDFTRSSNAYYYAGKFTRAEENLLTSSNTFIGGQWINVDNTGLTASVEDPYGGLTGTKLVPNTTNGIHRIFTGTVVTSADPDVYTYSVYAKASGYNYMVMFMNGADKGALFNLSNGTVTESEVAPYIGANKRITSLGNGWYRCSITARTGGNIQNLQIQVYNNTPASSYAGNGTSGIIVYGAQLERSSMYTGYTNTTGSAITNYMPHMSVAKANQPRLEIDLITGESKGLLIEEQRTNYFTYSSNYTDSAWSKYQCTVEGFDNVAPNGEKQAHKLRASAVGSSVFYRWQSLDAGTYTISSYFKAGTTNTAYFQVYDLNNVQLSRRVTFNLADQTSTIMSGDTILDRKVTSVGNGWYRCSMTFTTNATYTIYTDIGTYNQPVGSYLWLWGAQLEFGKFPTSYIESSSAATVRGADIATIRGINLLDFYNAKESTLFGEATSITGSANTGSNPALVSIDDGSNYNRWILRRNQVNTAGQSGFTFRLYTTAYSIDAFPSDSILPLWQDAEVHKMAMAISAGSQVAYADGIDAQLTSVASTSYASVGQMRIGYGESSAYWNGHIRKIAYYDKALSSETLKELTRS